MVIIVNDAGREPALDDLTYSNSPRSSAAGRKKPIWCADLMAVSDGLNAAELEHYLRDHSAGGLGGK
jgi:hypothetical protein